MLLAVVFSLTLFEEHWNQWRGPHRDGVTTQVASALPASLTQLWRVELGSGFGSPVTWGDRVFVTDSQKDEERLLCLDVQTGEILWSFQQPVVFKENSYATQFGKGPFATPMTDGKRVYSVSVTGEVHCLEASTGKVLWHGPFDGKLEGDRLLFCGNTVSPLLYDGMVITHVGDETHGRMTARDVETGRVIWTWDGDISGYASPVVGRFQGRDQLVTLSQNKILGLDPKTGKRLWEHPYQVQWRENIVTPLIHGDGVIVSGREQNAVMKLAVVQEKGQWRTRVQWRNEEMAMYMSSPVISGGQLVGFSHKQKGLLFGMDPKTGKILWKGAGRSGQNATLIAAGAHVLALTTAGELRVLASGPGAYQVLKTYKVSDNGPWAHPLPTASGLIIRDQSHLTAWKFQAGGS